MGSRAESPRIAAAIDVGSISVHLLIAAVHGDRLEPLIDASDFLGLGETVAATSQLGDRLLADLVTVVGGYADQARGLGATGIALVATEPLRRATDADAAVRAIKRQHRLTLEILGHDEEALLTLLGATAGRALTGQLLVVDVGGGSTEFIVVAPGSPPVTVGIRLGAARLTAQFVRADPPTPTEVTALLGGARRLVEGAPDAQPIEAIVVGGTASNLLRLVATATADRHLTLARIEAAQIMLSSDPADAIAARRAIRPARVRTLPAGAAIVQAVLERYDLPAIEVSEAGIREGAIRAVTAAGAIWRARLDELALGRLGTARRAPRAR